MQTFSGNFESVLLEILQQIPIPLLWIDGHQGMELRLCTAAELFCSPARNTAPHNSCMTFHIKGPCRDVCISLHIVVLCSCGDPGFKHVCFCNCRQYLCSFRTLVECNPNRRGQGMMLFLPNRHDSSVLSTLGQCCISSQPVLCRPHTQTRITPFLGVRLSIPNLDRTDFVQEERLGLPCWTISAICVLVDESKYLDILTLEFSIMTVHLPFRLGCKLILRLLLVLRILVALLRHPLLLQLSSVTLTNLAL